MSAKFIDHVGGFLISHMKEAVVTEELGRCMDDVVLEAIPCSWPLVSQVYLTAKLFEGLYKLSGNPVSGQVLSLTLCSYVGRTFQMGRSVEKLFFPNGGCSSRAGWQMLKSGTKSCCDCHSPPPSLGVASLPSTVSAVGTLPVLSNAHVWMLICAISLLLAIKAYFAPPP